MSITSRRRTIELGLTLHKSWPRLAELAAEFAFLWSDGRVLALQNEDSYCIWVGDLTTLFEEVMRLAGIKCDGQVALHVLVAATMYCGIVTVEGLAAVPPDMLRLPTHRAPRRHLEFAVAALTLLEDLFLTALDGLSEADVTALTRSYTRVTVAGGRDAAAEQVYESESQAVERFTEGDE